MAALTQSITGFGFARQRGLFGFQQKAIVEGAIVSMSFLPGIIGLQTAVPMVTLVGIVANIVIWYSYRRYCNFDAVKIVAIASLITTPFGVLLLKYIPEAIAYFFVS